MGDATTREGYWSWGRVHFVRLAKKRRILEEGAAGYTKVSPTHSVPHQLVNQGVPLRPWPG